jgi:2-hydroxychromene-2-carboxylate isomerase
MAHTLELYFDFSSPFAYLGATQAEALAARTGAQLVWRPMLLGGLFRAIGQVDVPLSAFSPAKQRYVARDMDRWAEFWGVPFRFPTRFPMNTVKALRAFLVLPEADRPAFALRTFKAYWADDRDLSDEAVLAELIGPGAAEVLAQCATQPIKDALKEATERAVAAGVFGAPTWVVDGTELFWGQDRLNLVERALGGTPRY